jgi:hypothetical protein
MMADGMFRQKTQVAFVELESHYFLTNGQHTLSAIVLSGCPQVLDVVVSSVRSREELADDYARHDTHLTRRFADSLVAHECDVELGVNRTQLSWIVAAIQYFAYITKLHSTDSTTQLTHDEKLALLRKHGKLAKDALYLFDGYSQSSWITRKSTLAPTMFTYINAPDLATEFWTTFAADDGLRATDPRKTLREWLRDSVTQGARRSVGGGAHNHELVKGIAACWNAWCEDRTLRFVRVDRDPTTATFVRCGQVRVKGSGPFPKLPDGDEQDAPSATKKRTPQADDGRQIPINISR